MNDIIKIDKKQITAFVEEAGKLVFKKEAEGSLIQLLDAIDYLNKQLEEVKEKITNAGLLVSPDFKGVVGEKIKAIFRNYGDRYNFTPDAPHEFIKEVKFDKVDTHAVDEYMKTHKTLPKGIVERDRKPKVSITRNNEI